MARTGTAQRDDSDSTGHLLHSSRRCRFVKIKHFKGNAISISFKTHIICDADYLEFASQLCRSSLYQSSNEFCSCTVSAIVDENVQTNELADKPPMGHMITVDPNTNLLYTKTKIPAVKYHIHKGTQEIVTRVNTEAIQSF